MREHKSITEKHLKQPFYYDRWYKCLNYNCKTTLIMLERHKVHREMKTEQKDKALVKRLELISVQLSESLPWEN